MATQETKRQSVKKVDGEKLQAGIYSAAFSDGTVIEVSVDSFNADIQRKLMLYGLKQKLDDSMALEAGSDLADYQAELASTIEALKGGQWTMRVAGEGVEGGLFARAYAQRHEVSLADAKAKISGLVEKNLKANQELHAGNKKALEAITERSVFNRLRDAALARDSALSGIYEELKAKRAAKKSPGVEMEISVD